MTNRGLFAACVGLLLWGCGGRGLPSTDAGPNLVDPSFGNGGSTLTSGGCTEWASPYALVARADGGFVAGGTACKGWALVGYAADGTIDPSYGDAGTALLFAGEGDFVSIQSLIARPDGRVIAQGTGKTLDFIRQFSPAGVEDLAFSAAVDQVLSSASITRLTTIALQPDGKLLIASGSGNGVQLLRLLPDGSLDTTFGTAGSVRVSPLGNLPLISHLLAHPDGRIVLVGSEVSRAGSYPFVAQLSAGGALDLSFGTGGVVKLLPQLDGTNMLFGANLQRDGKIILAGSVRASNLEGYRAALWRLDLSGSRDQSFGAKGAAEVPIGGARGAFAAVSELADGKIVAVGRYPDASLRDNWLVARFSHWGELDPELGFTGFSAFPVGVPSSPGGAYGLVPTAEGYVIAGRAFQASEQASSFGLVRVLP